MSRFHQIRRLLGLSQIEMAEVLGCVQSNVSFLDRGQTITPDAAAKIIAAAKAMGVALSYDHVYGTAPLPLPRAPRQQAGTGVDWREVLEALTDRGWTLVQIAAAIESRLSTVRALARGELNDAPHAVGCALLELQRRAQAQPAREPAKVG
jgi:putative transcriptional regulator